MNISPIFIEHTKKGFSGKKHSDESKKKISDSKSGKKNEKIRKLNQKQVEEIIIKKANGATVTSLALEYNVSRKTIYRYIQR